MPSDGPSDVMSCDLSTSSDVSRLQQLTENSVDVNSWDYDARTALHLAATEGRLG